MASGKHGTALSSLLAWGVHLFTASGVVCGFLALDAVERGEFRSALLWLFAALVIDGVDGTLARAARVAELLPRIDGAALDLIIDYLNYVLVPALLIWRAGFLPDVAAVPLCAAILLSSLYVFARRDMKTDDGYFLGFPALWNVVTVYFVIIPPGPTLAAIVVVSLVVLTFAPIHVVHPFRAKDARVIGPTFAITWMITTVLAAVLEIASMPFQICIGLSLASLFGIAGMGLRRSIRGPGIANGDRNSVDQCE